MINPQMESLVLVREVTSGQGRAACAWSLISENPRMDMKQVIQRAEEEGNKGRNAIAKGKHTLSQQRGEYRNMPHYINDSVTPSYHHPARQSTVCVCVLCPSQSVSIGPH